MYIRSRRFTAVIAVTLAVVLPRIAHATTKGFNQIVTPDIQPEGVLSISGQVQNSSIGNANEVQLEYGFTRNFEVAVFQGFSPHETIGNIEVGLLNKGPWLLSTGFSNWNSLGGRPSPFVVGGYYRGKHKLVAGAARAGSKTQGIYGYGYQLTPKVLLQADYQSGSGNSKTAGFTYSITPNLTFNPALYFTNDSPHHVYGYGVLSWSLNLK